MRKEISPLIFIDFICHTQYVRLTDISGISPREKNAQKGYQICILSYASNCIFQRIVNNRIITCCLWSRKKEVVRARVIYISHCWGLEAHDAFEKRCAILINPYMKPSMKLRYKTQLSETLIRYSVAQVEEVDVGLPRATPSPLTTVFVVINRFF